MVKRKKNNKRQKKTIRPQIRDARVWVQNIPANRIHAEYRQFLKNVQRKRNQSIRKSQQCVSNTLQRRQCKKRTAHTDQCWIHLAKNNNLRVKPSQIYNAGKGLFAWKKSFPAYKKISKYTGRRMTTKEINRKYRPGNAEYALCDRGICIDANYTTDAAARFCNDPRGSRFLANADLTGARGRFSLKSSKIIKPHQEIFTKYGEEYWKNKKKSFNFFLKKKNHNFFYLYKNIFFKKK